MKNNFPSQGSNDSALDAFVITPDDDNDLPTLPRGIWVGTGGDVYVTMASGEVPFLNVPDGTLLSIRPTRVLETSTAADMVALV